MLIFGKRGTIFDQFFSRSYSPRNLKVLQKSIESENYVGPTLFYGYLKKCGFKFAIIFNLFIISYTANYYKKRQFQKLTNNFFCENKLITYIFNL